MPPTPAEHLVTECRRDTCGGRTLCRRLGRPDVLVRRAGSLLIIFIILDSVGLTTARLLAAGFSVTAQGAAASGKSGAFTAQADDPSALYYNPAGITQLKTTELLVGTSIIVPRQAYHPDLGGPRWD
ncbi:MAG TPA: outer membrane protein transport protein, partial [Nitrospiria bacterium]|nr:outer membrane protein transport protein [Nitrospiria bacterium]